MTINIVDQNKIGQSAMQIREVILPDTTPPYAARAARFDLLAVSHPLAPYLQLCAALCRAQDSACKAVPVTLAQRDANYWQQCAQHGMPPLGGAAWPRDGVWRELLRHILAQLRGEAALADKARATIDGLGAASDAELEQAAGVLLSGDWSDLDRSQAPFIAAALQIWFNRQAVQLDSSGFSHNRSHTCPVCGSAPTASRLRLDCGGLRYLHCSLCETEWHHVRATCTQCESARDLGYWSDENHPSAMSAEGCGECHTYLKWLDTNKDTSADLLADDIATLSLDLAMDEKGLERAGPNLLFFGGL